jgi:hypothetical protein
MSYYIVKVYGLVCDNCEFSEEAVPRVDTRGKLAEARRILREDPASGWTFTGGKDLCPKCRAAT